MSFLAELKRRNVFRVGIAYAVAAWVLLQVLDVVGEILELPVWGGKLLLALIVTGFFVTLFVAWAFELTPEGIKRESEVDRAQSITAQTGRKLDRVIIGCLVVAVLILLADRFIPLPADRDGEPTSSASTEQLTEQASPEDPGSAEKSIAVLPFTNMSDDASNEYFADGISEEILNALAQANVLKVVGRTSSFAFKGRKEDLRVIGQALGVNHVLEGSVRKAGNTVRITAQLIQVSDGFHLWSETWDRKLTDIFAIQDEIAAAILKQLKATLAGDQSVVSTRVDPIVYEKYLRAKHGIYARTKPDLELAAELLREVTEAEPGFAAGWAQRAIATSLLGDRAYGTIPHGQAHRMTKQFLDTALKLDADQPEALAGMGLYFNNEPGGRTKNQQAAAYLERALELNPVLIDASNWLQQAYLGMGRSADVLRVLEGMFERDPLYRPGASNLAYRYAGNGQFDAAYRVLERIRPYIHDEAFLAAAEAVLFIFAGRLGEAIVKVRRASELEPANPQIQSVLHACMSALSLDEQLLTMGDTTYPYSRLVALLRLGRTEEGLLYAAEKSEDYGDPVFMIFSLHAVGKSRELADYADARWPDLRVYAAEYPEDPGSYRMTLPWLAYAYARVGNSAKYEQALALARLALDNYRANGPGTIDSFMQEASYWAIANDWEKALDSLQTAIDKGAAFPVSDLFRYPEFDGLLAEPRFQQLTLQAHKQFNEQRMLAGLETTESKHDH